jgi:aspartyl-tRNA(Asn)/glutamyl-tRNA(Gln) amidotransferase subunit A
MASASTQEATTKSFRILFVDQAGDHPIDPDVVASAEDAAGALADLGHRVKRGKAPYDVDEIDGIWSVLTAVGVKRVLDGFPAWAGKIDNALAAMADRAVGITAADYLGALDRVVTLRRTFSAAMAEFDAILTPTSAALPWSVERRFPATINGHEASPRAAAVFATFVNAVGHPAISLPAAPSATGLPIGIQIVGRFGEDSRVLALAQDFENARPWRGRWPLIAETGAAAGRPA